METEDTGPGKEVRNSPVDDSGYIYYYKLLPLRPSSQVNDLNIVFLKWLVKPDPRRGFSTDSDWNARLAFFVGDNQVVNHISVLSKPSSTCHFILVSVSSL